MGREMGRMLPFYWPGVLKELPDLLVSLVTAVAGGDPEGFWGLEVSLGLSSQPASPVLLV